MLDVTRRFHLALSDLGRRSGLIAGAAVLVVIGAGFLLAALWTFLARNLQWGPLLASLAVAGLCLVIAGGLLFAARDTRHTMPTADDVQAEMQARARLATDAAIGAVKIRATQTVDQAVGSVGQRLHGLLDRARFQMDRAADDLESGVERAVRAAGLEEAAPGRPAPNRAAPGVALASAFVVGVALSHFLRRNDDEDAEG